jgi:L-arabinose isomerase
MTDLKKYEAWFITGSQHLYGEETLKKVAEHAKEIAMGLHAETGIPVQIVYRPVVTTPDEIYKTLQEANQSEACIGLICWMHTFSPAKMWIRGLSVLHKPMLHLHTQYNRDIPWSSIDMDFMNLNQSAHGDREFGFIGARMRKPRKIVVGHWQDPEVIRQTAAWTRAAAAWQDWQGAKFIRFGDNMRQVAVTEGDKVEAEIRFGFSVNTHGTGDLAQALKLVTAEEIRKLVETYQNEYTWQENTDQGAVIEAARIELALRRILRHGGYKGFTDTFEDLHGIHQLPGIAVQRLLAEGYGFAAEGDWKTAALVRACKVMAAGLPGGNGFMEDYTYHFDPQNELVLGSHMLEIDASLAEGKPTLEVHPLGIGGKADPVRLVFNVKGGPALNASLVDMGNRFRLIVNEVEAVEPKEALPKLPVARVLWKPLPDMKNGCAAWLMAGGAHHTCFSQNLSYGHLQDFADIAGIECLQIGPGTQLSEFRKELMWNETAYRS